MVQIGGQRLRLAPYVRRPETRLSTALRWVRRGVFGLFALAGAIALGRTWTQPLFGLAPPGGEAHAASSASPDAATADAAARADSPAPTEQAAATVAAAPAATPASPTVAEAAMSLQDQKAAAEEVLEARVPEIDGLQYRNVKTDLSVANGQPVVNFCGEVNSLNPMGIYIGFQKFISSRQDAAIEQSMTPGAFLQIWNQRCTGAEGPKIWF